MRIPSGLKSLDFLHVASCSWLFLQLVFVPLLFPLCLGVPFSWFLSLHLHTFSHFLFWFLITFEKYSAPVSDGGSRINYQSIQSWGWLTVYNLRFSPQRPLVQLWCTIVLFASGKILLPVSFIPASIPPVPAMLPCIYNTSLTSRRLRFLWH